MRGYECSSRVFTGAYSSTDSVVELSCSPCIFSWAVCAMRTCWLLIISWWEVGVHEEVAASMHIAHRGVLKGKFLVSKVKLVWFELKLEKLLNRGQLSPWYCIRCWVKTYCPFCCHHDDFLTVPRYHALLNGCRPYIADISEKVFLSNLPNVLAFEDID